MASRVRPRPPRLLGVLVIGTVLLFAAPGAAPARTEAPVSASSVGAPAAATAPAPIESITSLLNGIPETANALGKPTAPVTLVYFGDLECPICRAFTLGALPSVIRTWVRTGDLRIVYASLETATRERQTFLKQQVAAYAAGAQHKAWYYIELFYHEQGEEDTGYMTPRYLERIARQIHGLDFARWQKARKLRRYSREVAGDTRAADELGLTGTPSFQIGPTGGPLKMLEVESLTDPESINRAVEGVLAG